MSTKKKEAKELKSNEKTLTISQLPQNGEEEGLTQHSFWDRIPKYKWWVTPLNIFFICGFLLVIDVVTPPNTSWLRIDWAWWPICGIIFAYLVSFILFKRPEIAWIVGPILMLGVSLLLLAIDLSLPQNEAPKLDWAIIPIAALLTFGVLIPIITKFGRKKQKPIEKFRKTIAEIQKQEVNSIDKPKIGDS